MNQNTSRSLLIIGLIVFAAIYRIIPFHVLNVAPIGAMALFGGANLKRKWQAILLPLAALFLGDLFLNNITYKTANSGFTLFYPGAAYVYFSFALISCIGLLFLKKANAKNVLMASIAGSILFYIITNFGVWMGSSMYPQTFSGLMSCYVAAIPFFVNTLAGDLLFSVILFGVYAYATSGKKIGSESVVKSLIK